MTQVDQNPAPPSQSGHQMHTPPDRPPAPRPRRRRFRVRLTREKVVEFLKTMAWVVPITILIWVYAEREQVITRTANDIPVRIATSDSNLFVDQSAGGPPPQVNLSLSGPQEGIEKAERELTSGITPGLQVDLGKTLQPSDQPQRINVVNRIQSAAVFKDNGVTVKDSTPAELEVTVDEVKERTVDIQLPPGLPNVDAAATTIEPRTTQIRGPARLLNSVNVYADLAKAAAALQPGVHALNDVPLQLTGADRITIVGPAKATIRLVIQSADETFTLPNPVPVIELITPTLQVGYDITLDPKSLTEVKVIGPPDKIQRLREEEAQNGPSPVVAVLELSTDDIGKGPKTVTLQGLPEGVRISPDSADKTVGFTLTPRGG